MFLKCRISTTLTLILHTFTVICCILSGRRSIIYSFYRTTQNNSPENKMLRNQDDGKAVLSTANEMFRKRK